MKFSPPIYALFCQIVSRQAFTHFLTVCQKNPQHDPVKPRGGEGGSKAVCTMCKKTSDLVAVGFTQAGKMLPNKTSSLCHGYDE